MKVRHLALLLAGAALALASGAKSVRAQTPAATAPNPLDAVPDKMPYSEPYGAPIGVDQAKKLIAAVEAAAKGRGWALNISVVDSGGNLVAFERMDGAMLASISISEHKARAAVKYRRETKVFEDAVQNGRAFITTLDDVVASRGGFPLIESGKIIGAIGCSGGTGSQDEASCSVGASMVK